MLDYIINWGLKHHPLDWTPDVANRMFRRIERLEGMKIVNWTPDEFYKMGLDYLDLNILAA